VLLEKQLDEGAPKQLWERFEDLQLELDEMLVARRLARFVIGSLGLWSARLKLG
jgi:hypothetical protein